MGTLILNLVGASVYVPHEKLESMMVVIPNATRLGTSCAGALDGTALCRHLPFFYREGTSSGEDAVSTPRYFPGCRLSFDIEGDPAKLNPKGIRDIYNAGWIDVNESTLIAAPRGCVSGQILIQHGEVKEYVLDEPCNKVWSNKADPGRIDSVVLGLCVIVNNVRKVRPVLRSWVGGTFPPLPVWPEEGELGDDDEITVFAGNLCAESALVWPQSSPGSSVEDADFKWVYSISASPVVKGWLQAGEKLPTPVVNGPPIRDHFSPEEAFKRALSGGGGAGCQCGGCVDKPKSFSA